MLVGIGIDLVELERIRHSLERFGQAFLDKILTADEQALAPSRTGDNGLGSAPYVAFVAARFAAKEAAVKALGTGFAGGIGFKDVEVGRLASGQPALRLYGRALEKAQALGAQRFLVSLTHSRETAGAVVILET